MIYYTQCVKLHTECTSSLGVCEKTMCNKSLDWCKNNIFFITYTLSLKVHLVCVNCDFIILCIFTHTECTYTQCICIQNMLFLHPSHDLITLCIFTHTECTQCVVLHTVCNYEMYIHTL